VPCTYCWLVDLSSSCMIMQHFDLGACRLISDSRSSWHCARVPGIYNTSTFLVASWTSSSSSCVCGHLSAAQSPPPPPPPPPPPLCVCLLATGCPNLHKTKPRALSLGMPESAAHQPSRLLVGLSDESLFGVLSFGTGRICCTSKRKESYQQRQACHPLSPKFLGAPPGDDVFVRGFPDRPQGMLRAWFWSQG
jgi:hypothetical protein